MARTHTFLDKFKTVAALKDIQADPASVSRFLKLQLLAKGLVSIEKVAPLTEGGERSRGRAAHRFVVSGKGRGFLALSGRWKTPSAVAA